MIPLIFTKSGDRVRIMRITGGRRCFYRLMQMGLRIGDVVEITQGGGGGPIILKKGNMRLVIGMGMAGKIWVMPLN